MKISYRTILGPAWQITWQKKVLWFFGIFASFISLEGVYEIFLSQISQLKRLDLFYQQILGLYNNQIEILNWHLYFWQIISRDWLAYFSIVLVLVIMLMFIWLVFTSQINIIQSVALLYHKKNKKDSHVLVGSFRKFWPVFTLNLMAKLVVYAGFIGLSIPLLYGLLVKNSSLLVSANLFFFLFFTVFAVLVSFITAYATNFIILKNLHIFQAVKEAWHLFIRNISLSLEIAFILFILKLISIVVIFSLLTLAFIPIFALFLYSLSAQTVLGVVSSITLLLLSFTLISLLINSVFTVFYLSCWTITFIKLTEETVFSKVMYYLKSIPELLKTQKANFDRQEFASKAVKIARQTEKEAKVINEILQDQYSIWEPKVKKQGKVLLTKLKRNYKKLEPKIKQELKKEIKKIKNANSKKRASSSRKTTVKKKTAPRPKAKPQKTVAKKSAVKTQKTAKKPKNK